MPLLFVTVGDVLSCLASERAVAGVMLPLDRRLVEAFVSVGVFDFVGVFIEWPSGSTACGITGSDSTTDTATVGL